MRADIYRGWPLKSEKIPESDERERRIERTGTIAKGSPKLRAGGGPGKATINKAESIGKHNITPTVVCKWNNWRVSNTNELLGGEINDLVGGAKAPQAIETYVGCSKQ